MGAPTRTHPHPRGEIPPLIPCGKALLPPRGHDYIGPVMSESSTRAETAAALLERSLSRGRLAHAYLFLGDDIDVLEDAAGRLAQTLNCAQPLRRGETGIPLEPCGTCNPCQRITHRNHPDVSWVRPEMKSRVISVDQVRSVIDRVNLRSSESAYKVAVFSSADRMNTFAANAFLKTLEEPPAGSVLILLSTEADRIPDTLLSRCQRLSFASGTVKVDETVATWVGQFASLAEPASPPLSGRYQLLGSLLTSLGSMKESIEEQLTAVSPLTRHADAEANQRERWEEELTAAIEAEYRRRRSQYAAGLAAWLRDVWMQTLGGPVDLAFLPQLAPATSRVASRLTPAEARANLDSWETTQRLLHTNAQEALVFEVGLLNLKL